MSSLRRAVQRHFGSHGRFHLAVVLSVFAVADVAVPRVARLLGSVARYNPAGYEPKDFVGSAGSASMAPRCWPASTGTRSSASRSFSWWPWCG